MISKTPESKNMEHAKSVYTCLFLNALLFVVLMCTNITAGIIYLFCFASLVVVCAGFACARYLCERCEVGPQKSSEAQNSSGPQHSST